MKGGDSGGGGTAVTAATVARLEPDESADADANSKSASPSQLQSQSQSHESPPQPCQHLRKGIDIDRLKAEIAKASSFSSFLQCKGCACGGGNGARKGLLKRFRKFAIAMAAAPQPLQKDSWICLACGNVACGSIAAESEGTAAATGMGQGHAWQHSLYSQHPYAARCSVDSLVCWCFSCRCFLDFDFVRRDEDEALVMVGSAAGKKLLQALRVVQDRLLKECAASVADRILLLSDAVLAAADDDDSEMSESNDNDNDSDSSTGNSAGYVVKGFVNLGNTCFFNAVMQILLSIGLLREHFCRPPPIPDGGPVSSCLRKLYQNTAKRGKGTAAPSAGANPAPLFSAICDCIPRFRGFQQQDSHELLRCLLDCLKIEELKALKSHCGLSEKSLKKSNDGNGSVDFHSFVDYVFRSELSSTIRCCRCGHSSVQYEAYLDLSLPIPQKQNSDRMLCLDDSAAHPSYAVEEDSDQCKESSSLGEKSDQCNGSQMDLHKRGLSNHSVVSEDNNTSKNTSSGVMRLPENYRDSEDSVTGIELRSAQGLFDKAVVSEHEVTDSRSGKLVEKLTEDGEVKVHIEGDSDTNSTQEDQVKVDFPGEQEQRNIRPSEALRNKRPMEVVLPKSIDGCLAAFTSPEILCNDNAWKCEKCTPSNLETTIKDDRREKNCENGLSRPEPRSVSKGLNGIRRSDGDVYSYMLASFLEEKLSSTRNFNVHREAKDNQSSGGKMHNAVKVLHINKAPLVLTIHLKRFTVMGGYLRKLSDHVNFQQRLDLRPFLDARFIEQHKDLITDDSFIKIMTYAMDLYPMCMHYEQKTVEDIINHCDSFDANADSLQLCLPHLRIKDKDNYTYQLIGVVEHSGTMICGHFVAYVRIQKAQDNYNDAEGIKSTWYRISDTFVREVSFTEVLQSEAYLLFYEKEEHQPHSSCD